MSLIAALFGGKSRPETNPLPGIGGYDMPRGPVGEGGFPGSTTAAPPVHPQSAEGIRQRRRTASQNQEDWATQPTRRRNGTPRQPYARDIKQAQDTETRSTFAIGANVPGDENQRNTKYYGGRQAAPGLPVTELSAHMSGGRKPQEVTTTNRYVWDGINGGVEDHGFNREIPYRIHARPPGYRGDPSNRGADLSGQRYTMAANQNLNSGGQGEFGIARKRGPLHRPVRFVQPGPWSANYYDVAPYAGETAPNMVHQSPATPATTHAKPAPKRANAVETRKAPGRVHKPERHAEHHKEHHRDEHHDRKHHDRRRRRG